MAALAFLLTVSLQAKGMSDVPRKEVELSGVTLPAEFLNDQIFLTPVTTNGETLTFFTDTGGGYNALSEEARLRAALAHAEPLEADGDTRPWNSRSSLPTTRFREHRAITGWKAGWL